MGLFDAFKKEKDITEKFRDEHKTVGKNAVKVVEPINDPQKIIDDVEVILDEIKKETNGKPIPNTSNEFLNTVQELTKKTKELSEVENLINAGITDTIQIIQQKVTQLNETAYSLLDMSGLHQKPKLWVYGCSMSNKHEYDTHDGTWYTLLAEKLDYELVIRSHLGFGINAIEKRIMEDLPKIRKGKDLVIFSPSFFHRVYINEFKDGHKAFLPSLGKQEWHKYLRDIDDIIEENYERWINICEIFQSMNINFRTWLLDPPLADEYPYERAKRMAKFEHWILKPPIFPQILGWMALQKQQPHYWFDDTPGKEDHHYNWEGHKYIADQFYKQITFKRALI